MTTGPTAMAVEGRLERALARFASDVSAPLGFELALPPVASPSYHAVESTTFTVSQGGGTPTLFLKLSGEETAELVDDDVAYEAQSRWFDLGFSPQPIARAPAERAVLSQYLGEGWKAARIDDLMHESTATRLVAMQKAIASGAPLGRPWSVFDGIDRLWMKLRGSSHLPADADWMANWMNTLRAALEAAGIDQRPAHGDPHSSNVMLGPDGAMQLVDFDMAGDMDPYYQLGVQMNELYQFETQMQPLLELHDGSVSRAKFARCRLYAAADDFYWALRSLLMEARSQAVGIEFLKYAGWRFLRCRMLLGHPGFEDYVRSV